MADKGEGRNGDFEPVIPANVKLPEITFKGIILAIFLAVVLAGANAYLGLFAGMTVSATIPAAVISMAVFSLFKKNNILENNIVQTAASAGEAVAAGVVFTIPGLVILGYWSHYNYWQTLMITALGGTIGVLFSVPLRRALVVQARHEIKFPEGIATAEVLKAGHTAKEGGALATMIIATLVGGFLKMCQDAGLKLWAGTFEVGTKVGGSLAYFGTDLSPALLGVGYIVGLNIAVLVFVGGAISWWIAIPIYAAIHGVPAGAHGAVEAATAIWSDQIRYLGVGAMCVGGLWALVQLRNQLLTGVVSGLKALKEEKSGSTINRTDRDIPMIWVIVFSILSIIPLFFVYHMVVRSLGVSLVMAVIMLVAGFLFAAVAGYMAGLVGSSNNPISGVTIATILFAALVLLLFLGHGNPAGPAAAILIGAVVCVAAAISGDNLQDLKAGYLVGASPWKQELMLIIGVLASSFVLAPILHLLNVKYGVGVPFHVSEAWLTAHPNPLPAPQATLMASVAQGVFKGGLPWTMVSIGAVIAVAIICLDQYLKAKGAEFRTPVLAVAVGIYLPFSLSVPILAGGLVAFFAGRFRKKLAARFGSTREMDLKQASEKGDRKGLLFASGLITGEALMGIALAVPITLASVVPAFKGDFMAIFKAPPFGGWPGLIVMLGVVYWLYRVVTKASRGVKE
jgi:putative OPT family oligopeptide transporter